MEKITGISILSKDYLEDLIITILEKDLNDRMAYVLKKTIDTKFLELALLSQDLSKYKTLLYKIIKLKLKGHTESTILEIIMQNDMYKEIIDKVNIKRKQKKVNYTSVLEILINKIKTISLYEFFVKYATYTNPIRMEDISNPDTFNMIMKEVEKLYESITDAFNVSEKEYTSEQSIEDRFTERVLRLLGKSKIKVISTGIPLLDAAFRSTSGMESGEIYIIGAPYGQGKTRFVVRLGANMYLNGANLYHITIENKLEDVEEMYDTALLGLSSEEIMLKIKKAVVENDDITNITTALNDIKSALKELYESRKNKIFFKKYHPYQVNVQMIRNWILMKMSTGAPAPDVIIVDHMDILIPSNEKASDSMFQRGEQIAGELKSLAEEFNCIVITPTQLNREGVKDNRRQIEAGGESTSRSMAKNELTGFLMTINQTRDEALKGYARLYIDKNRIGLSKIIIPIKFDKSKIQIEPVLDEVELKNFPNKVSEHVRILMQRLKGDFDYQTVSDGLDQENNIDNLINDYLENLGENDEFANIPIQHFDNLSDFVRNLINIEKDSISQCEIRENNDSICIVFDNVILSINRKLLIEKLSNLMIEKKNIYQKLVDSSLTLKQIIEYLNLAELNM